MNGQVGQHPAEFYSCMIGKSWLLLVSSAGQAIGVGETDKT